MTYITEAISKDTEGALVMVGSIGKVYMGLIEIDNGDMIFLGENLIALRNPLRYGEMVGPGATQQSMELNVQVGPIYQALGFMDSIILKFDSIYALKQENGNEQKLSSSYFDTVKQLLAKDSGLVAPTADDLRMVNSGN